MGNQDRVQIAEKTAKTDFAFGSVLATVISYANRHAAGRAILHGVKGRAYAAYRVLRY